MKRQPTRQSGFTLLELGIVLIVMGILASAAIPMVTASHQKYMREQDKQILEAAKSAIIGYAYVHKQLPSCVTCTDPSDAVRCDSLNTCNVETSLFTNLGVRWQDGRNKRLRYHPASALTSGDICTTPPTVTTTELKYGTPASGPQAFVLVAYGDDREPNLLNASVTTSSANYEDPQRAPDMRIEIPASYYDDMVVSVSLLDLQGRICSP